MSSALTLLNAAHTVGWLDLEQFSYVRSLFTMAGIGRRFDFHGSFASKADAVAKEKEVGGFIREKSVKGKRRYFVLTVKK